jgi:hypothetical protein
MQPLEAFPLRQVPVLFAPARQPLTGGVELLARGASHDAWHAVPLWHPGTRNAQQGDAPFHAGVNTTQPPQVGLLWGNLEVTFLPPLGEPPVASLRVVLLAAGAHPVVGLAAQPCLPPTVGFDDLVKPEVQGRVPLPMCPDG